MCVCVFDVPVIFRALLFEACDRMVNLIHGSAGILSSGKWEICQDGVENMLRGSFTAITHDNFVSRVMRMETMAFHVMHRLVMTKGKLEGLLHLKGKRKVCEHASTSNHMDSSCKSHGDMGNLTNNLQSVADNCT